MELSGVTFGFCTTGVSCFWRIESSRIILFREVSGTAWALHFLEATRALLVRKKIKKSCVTLFFKPAIINKHSKVLYRLFFDRVILCLYDYLIILYYIIFYYYFPEMIIIFTRDNIGCMRIWPVYIGDISS